MTDQGTELIPSDLHDMDGRITKTNEFLNCRYGDKFTNFDSMIFALMMGRIDPRELTFQDEEMFVADIAARFNTPLKSLYGRLDSFSDKATQCALDHKLADGSFRKIPFLHHFSYYSASTSEDGRAKIVWRFNDEMSSFLLGIDGKETPYTVLFFERFKRLSTKYAPRLYELLQQLIDFNKRKFILSSFREKLDIEGKYSTYGVLKNKVIVPAVKDINKYTDLQVVFDEVKVKNKVVGIKFRFWLDEEFIRQVVNKGQDILDASPVTTGFKNEADFISKMREVFEEHRNLKFERKLSRLTRVERQKLTEKFELEFKLLDVGTMAAQNYQKSGLQSSAIYSMFRGWAADRVLKNSSDYDFATFMEKKGHPVVADASGKYRLERPILTEA